MKKMVLPVIVLAFIGSVSIVVYGDAAQEEINFTHNYAKEVPLGFESLKEIISVHPLFVHFPIGLLIMSTFFYWTGAFIKNEGLIQAGRWTLYGGAVFSLVSVITGLKAAYTAPHDDEVHRIMLLHQNLGYIILILSAALSAWTLTVKSAIPVKGKWVFLVASLVLTLILAQQADFGGRMVFLKGVGVGSKSMLQKAKQSKFDIESHDHAH